MQKDQKFRIILGDVGSSRAARDTWDTVSERKEKGEQLSLGLFMLFLHSGVLQTPDKGRVVSLQSQGLRGHLATGNESTPIYSPE